MLGRFSGSVDFDSGHISPYKPELASAKIVRLLWEECERYYSFFRFWDLKDVPSVGEKVVLNDHWGRFLAEFSVEGILSRSNREIIMELKLYRVNIFLTPEQFLDLFKLRIARQENLFVLEEQAAES